MCGTIPSSREEKSRRLFREWYDALGGRPALKTWTYASRFNPFVRAIAPEFIGEIPKEAISENALLLAANGEGEYVNVSA